MEDKIAMIADIINDFGEDFAKMTPGEQEAAGQKIGDNLTDQGFVLIEDIFYAAAGVPSPE